jgi:AraC-like DNA-binding protein
MTLYEQSEAKRQIRAIKMNYRYHKVNHKLADYISAVLVFDNNANGQSSDLPLFTNGMSALLFKSESHITLFGQTVPGYEWATENYETMIAFFFKPFALSTIFKLSAQELKDGPVELSFWNPRKSVALSSQLYQSKSAQEKVEILSQFIFTQIESNKRDCDIIRYVTDIIMQCPNANILSQILHKLNLTERTFQRIFKKYVGVTANEYRRICQYYFSFLQLKARHFERLADVAYANGYFDQSHYIRSFKEFTNTTPYEYLQSGLKKKK